jgi:hypothetical protein
MMGGPGMQITGSWYNKRTGKTILVRDSYFDDTGMQIMTAEGNMISGEEFARDYIQCDDTIYDAEGNSTGQHEAVDYDAMFGGIENTFETPVNPVKTSSSSQSTAQVKTEVIPQNNPALEKLFSKLPDFPTLDINLKWDRIPIAELNMLKTIFDITDDDIAEYIYNNYCTPVEIKAAITEAIKRMI